MLDIIKEDQTETDTKEHIEVITLETDTSDMAEILQLLEPELEITTEDGYTGVLTPDYPSIQVEASGYGTSSRTVSATRTYPNLSSADVRSAIPPQPPTPAPPPANTPPATRSRRTTRGMSPRPAATP